MIINMPISHFQSTGMFLSVLYSFAIVFCRKHFRISYWTMATITFFLKYIKYAFA